MPIYIGDYLADTMHLTPEEHGGYLLSMMHYWKNGGAFPRSQLKGVIRITCQDALNNILAFYTEEKGVLHHKRIDKELIKAKKITGARSEAGKKSGEARRKNKQSNEQSANKVGTNAQTKDEQNAKPSPSPPPSHLNPPSHLQTPEEGVLKNNFLKGKYNVDFLLNDTGRAYARLNAPGWDLGELIKVYNQGIEDGKRTPPAKPNLAFAAWCKCYVKDKAL